MYDRDTIELALLALEEGMSQGEAAELAASPDHGGQLGAGPAAPRAQREARPSAHAASTASC